MTQHKILYRAPRRDMEFLLWEQIRIQDGLGFGSARDRAMVATALDDAIAFAEGPMAACYRESDEYEAHLGADGKVRVAPSYPGLMAGYRELWRSWMAARNAAPQAAAGTDEEVAAATVPQIVQQMGIEAMMGGNAAFMTYVGFLGPAMTLLEKFAAPELAARHLPHLASARATACLCITEREAGSDLSRIETVAERGPDGRYRMRGHKWLISAGSHEMAENIYYFVLARTDPEQTGMMGLSTFLVPRYRLGAAGEPAEENGVRVRNVVRKMGLRGCANTLLTFGEETETEAYLIGNREGAGLVHLMSMMKPARLSTGLFALGLAGLAQHSAEIYAERRVQGKSFSQSLAPRAESQVIARHPDIRRMRLEMNAYTSGCRALIARIGACQAISEDASRPEVERKQAGRLADILLPLAKAYSSDKAWRVTELAIQTMGGVGYTTDYAPQQAARDCKIMSIWEGTNHIQALYLIRDVFGMGLRATALAPLEEAVEAVVAAPAVSGGLSPASRAPLAAALAGLRKVLDLMGQTVRAGCMDVIPGLSVAFQDAVGDIALGWHLAEAAAIAAQALEAGSAETDYYRLKIDTAAHFLRRNLPLTLAALATIEAELASEIARAPAPERARKDRGSGLPVEGGVGSSMGALLLAAGIALGAAGLVRPVRADTPPSAAASSTGAAFSPPPAFNDAALAQATRQPALRFGYDLLWTATRPGGFDAALDGHETRIGYAALTLHFDKPFGPLSLSLDAAGIAGTDGSRRGRIRRANLTWNIDQNATLSLAKTPLAYSFFNLVHPLDPLRRTDFEPTTQDVFEGLDGVWSGQLSLDAGGSDLSLTVFRDKSDSYALGATVKPGVTLRWASTGGRNGYSVQITRSDIQGTRLGLGVDLDTGGALLVGELDLADRRLLREVTETGGVARFSPEQHGSYARLALGLRLAQPGVGQWDAVYFYNGQGYNGTEWHAYRAAVSRAAAEVKTGNYASTGFLAQALATQPVRFERRNYLALAYSSADTFPSLSINAGGYLGLDGGGAKLYLALGRSVGPAGMLTVTASTGLGARSTEFRGEATTLSLSLRRVF